ncbi:plastocyanin/azurin family copper-binding protein [Nitrosopumilus sp.]|nr:plastocyanin/azurin family copper-binding protein [Nitrosopumilus sp.]
MASIDKAAIVFSIAIALVGVGVAAMGSAVDNSPAAPTQQMSSSANTDAAEAKAAADAAAEARAEAAAEARAEAAADARAEAAADARAAEAKAAADAKAAAIQAEAAAIQAEAAAIQAEAAVAATAGPQTHIVETAMGSGAPGCETSNACYLPQDITISTGDTVQWDNVDNAAHTVTGGSPSDGPSGVFDSSLLMAGLDYSFTFDNAGSYDYFCMVHPWMVGSVTVN